MSGPVQLHPTKGLVVRTEHGGIMEEPIRDWDLGGACFGELATGSLLETIIIISPTVQFIASAVQGLWESQNHTWKQEIFPGVSS